MAIGCAHYGDGMCSLWRWDVFTMAMGCAHYGDGMCSLRRWDALTMALFRFKRQINWAWCHKSVMPGGLVQVPGQPGLIVSPRPGKVPSGQTTKSTGECGDTPVILAPGK